MPPPILPLLRTKKVFKLFLRKNFKLILILKIFFLNLQIPERLQRAQLLLKRSQNVRQMQKLTKKIIVVNHRKIAQLSKISIRESVRLRRS